MIGDRLKMVAFHLRPKFFDSLYDDEALSLRHAIIAFRRRERADREFQHSFFVIYDLKDVTLRLNIPSGKVYRFIETYPQPQLHTLPRDSLPYPVGNHRLAGDSFSMKGVPVIATTTDSSAPTRNPTMTLENGVALLNDEASLAHAT